MRLTGTADRIERESDGRIRIIDFKTGRVPPAANEIARMINLGSTSWQWPRGAFADVAGEAARPAARSWSTFAYRTGQPRLIRVFAQASLDEVPFPASEATTEQVSPTKPTWVHRRLAEAADIIRTERFDARIGPACRYCRFFDSCPAQRSGEQVVR